MIELSFEVFKKLVEITKKEKPNEASALLFDENKIVITGEGKMENSAGHFTIIDYGWVAELINKYGVPTAIFHSHPCEARPSGIDLTYMRTTIPFWGCKWLIMSDKYILRCWYYLPCCGLSEEEVRITDENK